MYGPTQNRNLMTDKKPNNVKTQPANSNDPLHGITLKVIVTELQKTLGWQGLSEQININCFKSDPSIKSSLTFLRRTPWAREKVEQLYVDVIVNGVTPTVKKKRNPSAFVSARKNGDSEGAARPSKPPINPWLKSAKKS